MVSKLAVLATVLMAVDVVTALYARATYPRLDRDMSAAFSDAEGLSKREKTCKAGKTLCNDEVAFCAHVCCYENGKFGEYPSLSGFCKKKYDAICSASIENPRY